MARIAKDIVELLKVYYVEKYFQNKIPLTTKAASVIAATRTAT